LFGVEFRPLVFDDVLGLEDLKEILRNILRTGNYDQGYLFSGSHATGKTTLGRIFARAILCESRQPDMSPCNKCQSCLEFLEERNSSYNEMDAASKGGKEDIQAIKDSLRYETLSRRKIILFDESHDISDAGKDALLILLERGDPNVILIFCTSERDKMPSTIASRCMDFCVQDPSEQNVRKKLEMVCEAKGIPYEEGALDDIVRAVGRHYRDAENRLRQVSMLGDITRENVKRAVSLYVDEAAGMLLTLPDDLTKCIMFSNFLVSKMSVHRIYALVVRILVDTIKSANGVAFPPGRYLDLLMALNRKYGAMSFEVLDYIVSKNRLSDLPVFQSDLLILHYRFQKGSFVPQEVVTKSSAPGKQKKDPEKEAAPGVIRAPTITELSNLPDGKREDVVRQYKESMRRKKVEERVPEQVSKIWGPDQKEEVEGLIHRKPLSRTEVERVLKGSNNGEKI
jgi:DNA polymerase III subunit gamma/tau